jgi:hypothetical protein
LQEESQLIEVWNDCRNYTGVVRSIIFPRIAERLGLSCYPGDYYTLDSIFYTKRDTINFASHLTYASFISVALEHENDPGGTAVEINKLQLFSAPLKVLITYPDAEGPKNIDSLLKKYAAMIQAADAFEDFSTLRRQLVIFGRRDAESVVWQGYEYCQGSFQEVTERV